MVYFGEALNLAEEVISELCGASCCFAAGGGTHDDSVRWRVD